MSQPAFDIVLFGATGFTGRLTAHYLARRAKAEGARIALAGRNLEKLQALRREIVAAGDDGDGAATIELIVADVADPASLRAMADRARVVLTTVGPYAEHGMPVVEACVAQGADYVDITGEPSFWKAVVERFHTMAQRQGITLVPCCGFDSIPPDLGAFYTVQQLTDEERQGPVTVESFVKAKGAISGGTWHSAVNAVSKLRQTRASQQHPDGPRPRGPRPTLDLKPYHEALVEGWVAPMPTIDPAVVLRSAGLFAEDGDDYGQGFAFGHFMRVGKLSNLVKLGAGLGATVALAQFKPTRDKLLSWRERGEGPSAAERATNFFELTLRARASSGHEVVTRVAGGDPGYGETSRMVAESAMCLALDRDRLPRRGGVLTPASAFGMRLVERLQEAGLTFEVVKA